MTKHWMSHWSRTGITLVGSSLDYFFGRDGLNMCQILRLQSLAALSLRMTKWERGRSCRMTAVERNFIGSFKQTKFYLF